MDGWGRVVAAVIDRRAELNWTQKELAAKAGVSERTVQNLEAGSRPQAGNRHKIERALSWPNGEMRRIEEGNDRSPPPERLSRETRAGIRHDLADNPVLAEQVIAYVEGLASGRIAPAAPAAPQGEPGSARRRARG